MTLLGNYTDFPSGPQVAFWEMTSRAGEWKGWCRPFGGRYLCLPMGLLNQRRLSIHRSRLLPFGFLFALFVGRALPCGDLVEGAPLCLHPDVGVPREHGAGDVSGDTHDHLFARA